MLANQAIELLLMRAPEQVSYFANVIHRSIMTLKKHMFRGLVKGEILKKENFCLTTKWIA